jgi:hypothetical protein
MIYIVFHISTEALSFEYLNILFYIKAAENHPQNSTLSRLSYFYKERWWQPYNKTNNNNSRQTLRTTCPTKYRGQCCLLWLFSVYILVATTDVCSSGAILTGKKKWNPYYEICNCTTKSIVYSSYFLTIISILWKYTVIMDNQNLFYFQ